MLGGPFIGMAVDKFGTRKLGIIGMVLAGLAFAAFSLLNGSIVQWIALYVIYGIFALAIKSTVWSAGISSVFTHARSLARLLPTSSSTRSAGVRPISGWDSDGPAWRSCC